MSNDQSFGDWLRQHRRALDLTQEELARQVACSAITLRKLEAEERKPSKQIAERLADVFRVPPAERADFLRFARGDPFAAPGAVQEPNAPPDREPPAARRHNLPVQVTHFFGRENEIASLKQRLAEHRLVTLTGSGGVGKTRLSLQAAGEMLDDFDGGVWLVELAALTKPALLPQYVAAVLGVRENRGQSVLESLMLFLHERQVLLVLDNCEHLLDACAQLAETLLRTAPGLKLLATSREPLGIAGEAALDLRSLPFPDPDHLPPIEKLNDYTAISLFVDRARLVLPDYKAADHNAASVARICQRLDGIPLAIELAAARVNVISATKLAERLDDAFGVLTGGNRTALPRQQTLRATMDWSYALLSDAECRLLQRLSVFAGGCTLEAAEAVCSDDPIERGQRRGDNLPLAAGRSIDLGQSEILHLLSLLVGKSMVIADHRPGGETRYHLLETVHQYAREKLLNSGEGQDLRDRHLAFYLWLAEEIEPQLKTAERLVSMKQLRTELDNFRGALEWSLAEIDPARAQQGLRLASTLRRFWQYCGYLAEGRAWLEQGLAALGSAHSGLTEIRAKVLHTAGWLARYQGDPSSAVETLLEESIALYRQVVWADPRNLSDVLNVLAMAKVSGDPVLARSLTAESMTICRALGSVGTWELAEALFYDGRVVQLLGDFTTARARAEESCALFRHSGDKWSAAAPITMLGYIAVRQGDYVAARSYYEESLRLAREAGNVQGTAGSLDGLGAIDRFLGDYEALSAHSQESLRLWRDMGHKWGILNNLRRLGIAAACQCDYERARALLLESVALLREAILTELATDYAPDVSDHYAIALTLAGFSIVARARGQRNRATRLLRGAESLVMSMAGLKNEVLSLGAITDRIEYERLVAEEHSRLPESTLAAVSAEDQSMTWEQAIELALQFEAEA